MTVTFIRHYDSPLGGVLLAYIRTRAGLIAAMGYHAAYNALVVAAIAMGL